MKSKEHSDKHIKVAKYQTLAIGKTKTEIP